MLRLTIYTLKLADVVLSITPFPPQKSHAARPNCSPPAAAVWKFRIFSGFLAAETQKRRRRCRRRRRLLHLDRLVLSRARRREALPRRVASGVYKCLSLYCLFLLRPGAARSAFYSSPSVFLIFSSFSLRVFLRRMRGKFGFFGFCPRVRAPVLFSFVCI